MTDHCTIQLLNPTEVLVTGPEALLDWREEQRLKVPGAEFTPRYKRGQWDGTYVPGKWCRRNGNAWELRGSRGLVGRLATAFTCHFERNRPLGYTQTTSDAKATLRDYQWNAILVALDYQWGRIALATNAGKGAVIALLAELACFQQTPVLILCDEISVFDELEKQLAKWAGITPGKIEQGQKELPADVITLAMVPTLARRLHKDNPTRGQWREWVSGRGMLLLDEADKATAPTWRRIIACAKGAHYRIGFSGTFPDPQQQPYEDLVLDELMGPVLIEAKNIEMVKRKVSARPLVELHGFDITDSLTRGSKEYWALAAPQRRQRVYEETIVDNVERHEFIARLIQPNTPTAIVVNRIAHGQALATGIIPGAVFLDGSVEPGHRREVLRQFQDGEIMVLIVTKILDRGTNRLGHASDLIFAAAEGSTRQTLQRIGRGLRRTGGKEFLRLVDVIDRVDTDVKQSKYAAKAADFLHRAAQKRIRLYRDEGFDVEIVK